MDDCASVNLVLAFPSCRVRSAIFFGMFATVSRSDWVAVARFAKAWLWSCVISADMAAFAKFCVFGCPSVVLSRLWRGCDWACGGAFGSGSSFG